jgi:hypothetical protein
MGLLHNGGSDSNNVAADLHTTGENSSLYIVEEFLRRSRLLNLSGEKTDLIGMQPEGVSRMLSKERSASASFSRNHSSAC